MLGRALSPFQKIVPLAPLEKLPGLSLKLPNVDRGPSAANNDGPNVQKLRQLRNA